MSSKSKTKIIMAPKIPNLYFFSLFIITSRHFLKIVLVTIRLPLQSSKRMALLSLLGLYLPSNVGRGLI